MRTERLLALTLTTLLAGCASSPPTAGNAAAAPVADAAGCVAPTGPVARADLCTYPGEVRDFVEDRDACDHFRGEPWPEGDTAADRQRRRELVEGIRTACAGTDRRLADLRQRYAADARISALLSGFETSVGD